MPFSGSLPLYVYKKAKILTARGDCVIMYTTRRPL
jgi:hypothetical protein